MNIMQTYISTQIRLRFYTLTHQWTGQLCATNWWSLPLHGLLFQYPTTVLVTLHTLDYFIYLFFMSTKPGYTAIIVC